jgi:hypothetical protein
MKRALRGIQFKIVALTLIVMVLFAVDLDERYLLFGAEDNVTYFFAQKESELLVTCKES